MPMNLPNKLTILRIVLIPFFVVFMLPSVVAAFPAAKWVAVIIFCIASLTDLFDGKIARKYNLVTNFGKFMDPLADKMLVSSAFICLIDQQRIAAWIVIVIIAREFVISGFRLVASDNGRVIAASYWGKFKTTFQMFAIIMLIVNLSETIPSAATAIVIIENVLVYIALILTIVSLVDYMVKNIDILKEGGSDK